jgi:hypothetical protein
MAGFVAPSTSFFVLRMEHCVLTRKMAMTQDSIVVGVFREPTQARRAIEELHRAGYRDDEIGYLTRVGTAETGDDTLSSATTGAVGGGIVGGVLGAVGALLIPGLGPVVAGGILLVTLGAAGVGALAGSFIGMLIGRGVPEAEAHYYQRELEAGRTIVTVKTTSGQGEALAILQRNGAYDAASRYSQFNATPPIRPYRAGSTSSQTREPDEVSPESINLLPPQETEDDQAPS